MKDIEKISCIAEYLQLDNVVEELKAIDFRSKQENANLILPLVGEFSSGKTTLINALTDCKKLETATKPTTATIYEVHFGCNTCRADVVDENGNIRGVEDIASLKNEELTEAQVVTVFDTSKRVPSNTILVDTPGLSSPDPKHKQTLVNFLPQADGIMLVTDINQQITRSLTDFIETMKLSKRPIYLILTKADTKSGSEIEAAKKYISDNCQIPLKQMAVVSAVKDSLDDLYALFDAIRRDKKEIIRHVDEHRVNNIVKTLTQRVEELMKASSSDKEMDEAVIRCQHELDKINRNIDRLIDSMADDIRDQERSVSRNFEDTISAKLNNLVTNKSNNLDAEAVSLINNTATLLMSNYKNGIHTILRDKAQSQKGSENEVSLSSLENLDLSSLQMSELSYNLDLNTMGHEYDGWIKTGVIAAAVAAAMASTGGAAAGAAASKTIETVSKIEKATNKYKTIVQANLQMGQQMGNNKGLIDPIVGFATDNMISKPQRIRAIRNYIDDILAPEFNLQLDNISQTVESSIRSDLHSEASTLISQKTEELNQLKAEMAEKKEQFNQKMSKLREIKATLLTI